MSDKEYIYIFKKKCKTCFGRGQVKYSFPLTNRQGRHVKTSNCITTLCLCVRKILKDVAFSKSYSIIAVPKRNAK